MLTTSTKPPRAAWACAKRERSCTQQIRSVQHRSLRIIFHRAKYKKCTRKRTYLARMRVGTRAHLEQTLGTRTSGAHAGERDARAPSGCSGRIAPECARIVSSEPQRGQDARAPFEFMGARLRRACERGYASSAQAGRDARASSGCSGRIAPGCARLRRACKRGCTSGAHVNRDTTAQPASLRRVNL